MPDDVFRAATTVMTRESQLLVHWWWGLMNALRFSLLRMGMGYWPSYGSSHKRSIGYGSGTL